MVATLTLHPQPTLSHKEPAPRARACGVLLAGRVPWASRGAPSAAPQSLQRAKGLQKSQGGPGRPSSKCCRNQAQTHPPVGQPDGGAFWHLPQFPHWRFTPWEKVLPFACELPGITKGPQWVTDWATVCDRPTFRSSQYTHSGGSRAGSCPAQHRSSRSSSPACDDMATRDPRAEPSTPARHDDAATQEPCTHPSNSN